MYILYSKISTDPGLLKIRHSHRFVAVVIQILIPSMPNAPDIVLCSKLCRYDPTDPTQNKGGGGGYSGPLP